MCERKKPVREATLCLRRGTFWRKTVMETVEGSEVLGLGEGEGSWVDVAQLLSQQLKDLV